MDSACTLAFAFMRNMNLKIIHFSTPSNVIVVRLANRYRATRTPFIRSSQIISRAIPKLERKFPIILCASRTTKAKWNRNTENVRVVVCRLRRTRTWTETRDKTTKMKLLDYTSELFYYVHKLVNRIAWPHNRDNMALGARFEECARSSETRARAGDIAFWHKLTFFSTQCSFMHGKRDGCCFNWIHVWWISKSIC